MGCRVNRLFRLDPRLSVWHQTKARELAVQSAGGFVVETCQRALSVGGPPIDLTGFRHYRGVAAYQMLLEISTGLRSELAGETNVFGQIKQAWETQRANLSDQHQYWVEQWFADTKAIRAEHLQGVGGDSYASLCRQFLALHRDATVCIVGGGQLAVSMLSLFRRHSCKLFVRSAPRFPVPSGVIVVPIDSLSQHIRDTGAIIACTPPNASWEGPLIALLRRYPRPLIHLGYRHYDGAPLGCVPNCHSLDALFLLKRQRANIRSIKLAAAKRACARRAEKAFQELDTVGAYVAEAQ